jgi:hypothetical protein
MVVFPVPCKTWELVSNARTNTERPDLASENQMVMASLGSVDNTIDSVLLLPPQIVYPGVMPNAVFVDGIRHVPIFQRLLCMHD